MLRYVTVIALQSQLDNVQSTFVFFSYTDERRSHLYIFNFGVEETVSIIHLKVILKPEISFNILKDFCMLLQESIRRKRRNTNIGCTFVLSVGEIHFFKNFFSVSCIHNLLGK